MEKIMVSSLDKKENKNNIKETIRDKFLLEIKSNIILSWKEYFKGLEINNFPFEEKILSEEKIHEFFKRVIESKNLNTNFLNLLGDLDKLHIYSLNSAKNIIEQILKNYIQFNSNYLKENEYRNIISLLNLCEFKDFVGPHPNIFSALGGGSYGAIYLGWMYSQDINGKLPSMTIGFSAGSLYPTLYYLWKKASTANPTRVPFNYESLIENVDLKLENENILFDGDILISRFTEKFKYLVEIINQSLPNAKHKPIEEITFRDLGIPVAVIASRQTSNDYQNVIFGLDDKVLDTIKFSSNLKVDLLLFKLSLTNNNKAFGNEWYDGIHSYDYSPYNYTLHMIPSNITEIKPFEGIKSKINPDKINDLEFGMRNSLFYGGEIRFMKGRPSDSILSENFSLSSVKKLSLWGRILGENIGILDPYISNLLGENSKEFMKDVLESYMNLGYGSFVLTNNILFEKDFVKISNLIFNDLDFLSNDRKLELFVNKQLPTLKVDYESLDFLNILKIILNSSPNDYLVLKIFDKKTYNPYVIEYYDNYISKIIDELSNEKVKIISHVIFNNDDMLSKSTQAILKKLGQENIVETKSKQDNSVDYKDLYMKKGYFEYKKWKIESLNNNEFLDFFIIYGIEYDFLYHGGKFTSNLILNNKQFKIPQTHSFLKLDDKFYPIESFIINNLFNSADRLTLIKAIYISELTLQQKLNIYTLIIKKYNGKIHNFAHYEEEKSTFELLSKYYFGEQTLKTASTKETQSTINIDGLNGIKVR